MPVCTHYYAVPENFLSSKVGSVIVLVGKSNKALVHFCMYTTPTNIGKALIERLEKQHNAKSMKTRHEGIEWIGAGRGALQGQGRAPRRQSRGRRLPRSRRHHVHVPRGLRPHIPLRQLTARRRTRHVGLAASRSRVLVSTGQVGLSRPRSLEPPVGLMTRRPQPARSTSESETPPFIQE